MLKLDWTDKFCPSVAISTLGVSGGYKTFVLLMCKNSRNTQGNGTIFIVNLNGIYDCIKDFHPDLESTEIFVSLKT